MILVSAPVTRFLILSFLTSVQVSIQDLFATKKNQLAAVSPNEGKQLLTLLGALTTNTNMLTQAIVDLPLWGNRTGQLSEARDQYRMSSDEMTRAMRSAGHEVPVNRQAISSAISALHFNAMKADRFLTFLKRYESIAWLSESLSKNNSSRIKRDCDTLKINKEGEDVYKALMSLFSKLHEMMGSLVKPASGDSCTMEETSKEGTKDRISNEVQITTGNIQKVLSEIGCQFEEIS